MDVTAYVDAGAVLSGGRGGAVATDSTRYSGKKPTSRGNSKGKSRETYYAEKRLLHRGLANLLREMGEGQHGVCAKAFAEKHLSTVLRCPGTTRRHTVCGGLSFEPFSCDLSVCSWCQGRRAVAWRNSLNEIIEKVSLAEPKLLTLTVPNLEFLDNASVRAIGKAFTHFRRLGPMKGVRGGVRTIEVTRNKKNGTWHLHIHALLDGPFLRHYEADEIKRVGSCWEVVEHHLGLARAWTMACQLQPALRRVLDIENPNDLYFIDIRRADKGAVDEVTKYITKQSEIVLAGASALMDFVAAMRGVHLIKTFGSLYNVVDIDSRTGRVDLFDDLDHVPVEKTADGHCPHEGCLAPGVQDWEYVCRGLPETSLTVNTEWVGRVGLYRVKILAGDAA